MSASTTPESLQVPVPVYRFNIYPEMVRKNTTVAFITELAYATGKDPLDFPPLDNYIDTDAFNDLLAPDGGFAHTLLRFDFSYEDYDVTVHRNGDVAIGQ